MEVSRKSPQVRYGEGTDRRGLDLGNARRAELASLSDAADPSLTRRLEPMRLPSLFDRPSRLHMSCTGQDGVDRLDDQIIGHRFAQHQ